MVVGQRIHNVDAGVNVRVQHNICADRKVGGEQPISMERERMAKNTVDTGEGVVADNQEDVGVRRCTADKKSAKGALFVEKKWGVRKLTQVY